MFRKKILHIICELMLTLGIDFPPLVTVSAIIVREGKILVLEVAKGKFTFPGGVLKKRETLVEGLRREVLEETGLWIIDSKYFNQYACHVEYPTINFVYLVKTKNNRLSVSTEGRPQFINPILIKDKLVHLDNKLALEDYLSKNR